MSDTSIHLAPLYHTVNTGVDRPYCLNYINSAGELAVTRFTYDKGRNVNAFYQDITGGRSSRNIHTFDREGRMIRKERTYNDGETSLEQFEYDKKGRLASESFEDSKGKMGVTTYKYNKANQAVRMICEGYKGWFVGEITFTFDKQGKRREGTLHQDGKPVGTIAYVYDSGGNLLKEEWKLGPTWNQILQYVYESA